MNSVDSVIIPSCSDFPLDGAGSHPAWAASPWLELSQVDGPHPGYRTRTKLMYSSTAFYALVECSDHFITCSGLPDMGALFTEDVVELFLWPDERMPLYLEYELSPLNAELVLLVSNREGTFHGWLPFDYHGGRRCRHETRIIGGTRAAGAAVSGWTAEFAIPWTLFSGVGEIPPDQHSRWHLNLGRIDYDEGRRRHATLSARTGANFHDYRSFLPVRFAALPD
jgi:hypothetical protein